MENVKRKGKQRRLRVKKGDKEGTVTMQRGRKVSFKRKRKQQIKRKWSENMNEKEVWRGMKQRVNLKMREIEEKRVNK